MPEAAGPLSTTSLDAITAAFEADPLDLTDAKLDALRAALA